MSKISVFDFSAFGGEPVRGGELGILHAERLGAGVHARDEGLAAAGDLGERVRGVVRRFDHEREEQLLDGKGLTGRKVDLGAAHGLIRGGGRDRRVEADLPGGDAAVVLVVGAVVALAELTPPIAELLGFARLDGSNLVAVLAAALLVLLVLETFKRFWRSRPTRRPTA